MDTFDEKQINQLKRLMTLMEPDGLTKSEFIKSFQEVIKLVVKIEADLVKKINTLVDDKVSSGVSSLAEMKGELQRAVADVRKANDSTFSVMKQRAMESMQAMFTKMDIQGKIDSMYQEHEAMMQKMESVLPDTEKMMKDMLAKVPKDTAEEERDRLESLKGDDRLDKSAIKGFDAVEADIIGLKSRYIGPGRSLLQLYINSAKKGAVQYINLIPGSGIALTYAHTGGRNDVTISATGSVALTPIAMTGTIDDSNVSFTAASTPTIVIVNGAAYRDGFGCTIVATAVTLNSPVGSGGDLYGL